MSLATQPASGPRAPSADLLWDGPALAAAIARIREPLQIWQHATNGGLGVTVGATAAPASCVPYGSLPPAYPEWLGDRAFCETHGLRFPYVAGEMANGIATTRMVIAVARAGMLGFFGAAGLSLAEVERALVELEAALGTEVPWGVNLIHSPAEPELELALADLLLRRGVRRISASAFMGLTPAVVRVATVGLHRDASRRVARRQHVFAKVSRAEVAAAFMAPAPRAILDGLVAARLVTADEAALAAEVPVAEDITVEADSGGHTDNRPLVALFPAIRALAEATSASARYPRPVRVGVGGGLGTPAAVAAAFSLGAAYVVTGSVNQAAVEAGLSDAGKRLLAEAASSDVIMAPAADMFEMGVNVQVLRRGTMFGMRAKKLYELYRAYDALEAMPADVRAALERDVLGSPVDAVWSEVQRYFTASDPRELARAAAEPKHRMALVFRWYLGLSSKWAISGEPSRRADYQIWCGPAMGAFNDWARGSFLEGPHARSVVQIALNFLEGAAAIQRAQQLRGLGVAVPQAAFSFAPRPLG